MATLREMREAARKAFEQNFKGEIENVETVGNKGSTHDPRTLPNTEKEEEDEE